MSGTRPPSIAILGTASWETLLNLDHYPKPGTETTVRDIISRPGGTAAPVAMILAGLGANVALWTAVGDDPAGHQYRTALERAVAVCSVIIKVGEPTAVQTILLSEEPPARTALRRPGAHLRRGDQIDVTTLFGHDLVLIDVTDAPLRRFLVDLPAHTLPNTRLLGTLTDLLNGAEPDAFAVALRHDALIGSEEELLRLTGTTTVDTAAAALRQAMRGANLRAVAIHGDRHGCSIWTRDDVWRLTTAPPPAGDRGGPGYAWMAGIAYGMACRWDWPTTGRLAGALSTLPSARNGATRVRPTWDEVRPLLGEESGSLGVGFEDCT